MKLTPDMLPRFARSVARLFRFRPPFAPPPIMRERIAICEKCEYKQGTQCKLCGCMIFAKAAFRHEYCPDTPPRWLDIV